MEPKRYKVINVQRYVKREDGMFVVKTTRGNLVTECTLKRYDDLPGHNSISAPAEEASVPIEPDRPADKVGSIDPAEDVVEKNRPIISFEDNYFPLPVDCAESTEYAEDEVMYQESRTKPIEKIAWLIKNIF